MGVDARRGLGLAPVAAMEKSPFLVGGRPEQFPPGPRYAPTPRRVNPGSGYGTPSLGDCSPDYRYWWRTGEKNEDTAVLASHELIAHPAASISPGTTTTQNQRARALGGAKQTDSETQDRQRAGCSYMEGRVCL